MSTDGVISQTDRLVEGARAMLRARRPAAARPLLAALARLAPSDGVVAELQSGLAAAENDLPAAIAALDRGLTIAPGDADLRRRRAALRQRTGDTAGALLDAAEVVIAAPTDPSAKALLGLLLIEAGKSESALVCLKEAAATDPDNVCFQLGLAEAAERAGERELARVALEEAMKRCPHSVQLRGAAMRFALRRGDSQKALGIGEAARRDGVVDANVLRLLAEAAAARGRSGDAIAAVVEARQLDPADPGLRHCAAAAGLLPAADRAPIGSVRTRFDAIAQRFDQEMVQAGDRVPGLFRAALLAHGAPPPVSGRLGPVLDLGCGTGLAAVALSDLPIGPFVGVDIAPRMLTMAASTGLYAELFQADLMELLAEEPRCFPLILAADVLCWFGPLESVFSAVAARLAPRGMFVFSVDTTSRLLGPDRQWTLRLDGRYVHGRVGLEQAARSAGLSVRSLVEVPLRNEGSEPVHGVIGVLGRTPDAK